MIIDEHHPDFHRYNVFDQDGNPIHNVISIDTHGMTYTTLDSVSATGRTLTQHKVKHVHRDWYTYKIIITHFDP